MINLGTHLLPLLSLHSALEEAPQSFYTYKPRQLNVRTTAYTHSESDHVQYGKKTALGTRLKWDQEYHSAAADWSKYPVGTEFRILGINRHFVIDDYGSALVGKDTIDLYFPSRSMMDRWGARHVDVVITKHGDFEKSLEILKGRTRHQHCRQMYEGIKANAKSSVIESSEPLPEVPEEIDPTLMAAASIPKAEWKLDPPEILPDPMAPETTELPVMLASHGDAAIVEPPLPPESEWDAPLVVCYFESETPASHRSEPARSRSFRRIAKNPVPPESELVSNGRISVDYMHVRRVREFRPIQ